jgi:enediyne biosynthesis protein E4
VVTDNAPATFLYRNDGGGGFTPLTNAITLDSGNVLLPTWADYDNDGKLDLFVGHYNSTSRVFHNEGEGVFTKMEIGAARQNAFGTWADVDNDGHLDLMISGGQSYDVRQQFYHNNGDGTFTELTNIAPATYIGRFGTGIWADYDNDGFLDLFLPHMRTMDNSLLFHNNGNSNHWLMVKLEGTVCNRAAIGAKVRVKATIGGKTFWQMREISGGNGSMSDMRAHFGLGDATNAEITRVEWPSGQVTELHNVTSKQIVTIVEPNLQAVGPSTNGAQLTLKGRIGSTYNISTCTDLAAPNWQPWRSVTCTNSVMTITDTNAVPWRFYRSDEPLAPTTRKAL